MSKANKEKGDIPKYEPKPGKSENENQAKQLKETIKGMNESDLPDTPKEVSPTIKVRYDKKP